jgi:DNA-binding NtrC family response regulator
MCNDPVLFVDDDLISRLLNCAVLRESGFDVIEARSPAEADGIIESRAIFAALVIDADLGDLDGLRLARRAREVNPELAVVYMCDEDLSEYALGGVQGSCFVPRPFNADQIVRALDEAAPCLPTR